MYRLYVGFFFLIFFINSTKYLYLSKKNATGVTQFLYSSNLHTLQSSHATGRYEVSLYRTATVRYGKKIELLRTIFFLNGLKKFLLCWVLNGVVLYVEYFCTVHLKIHYSK